MFLFFADSGLSIFAFGRDRERTRDFYFLQTPVGIAALAMQTRFALQDAGGGVRTGWAQRGSGTRGSIWNWIPAGSPRVFSVPNGFDIFRRPSSADWVRLEKRRAPHIIEHDSRGTKCGSRFSHTQSRFSTLHYCKVLNQDCVWKWQFYQKWQSPGSEIFIWDPFFSGMQRRVNLRKKRYLR